MRQVRESVADGLAGSGAGAAPAGGVQEDALSALVNLGYRRAEAAPVVARVADGMGENPDLGAVLRAALRELAQRLQG